MQEAIIIFQALHSLDHGKFLKSMELELTWPIHFVFYDSPANEFFFLLGKVKYSVGSKSLQAKT